MDTLLELNDAGANFSDEEIRDEVVTMLIGVSKKLITFQIYDAISLEYINKLQGSETSAITNCFCLLMLAMHPEIQVSCLIKYLMFKL